MTMKSETSVIRRIYRKKEFDKINAKITMLGDTKLTTDNFMNYRLITTLMVFILLLYTTEFSYVIAPIITVIYYYLFNYYLIDLPLKKRTRKLDNEALYFFEILALTLEGGCNLETSLETTVLNVHNELSEEFKKTLFEIKFGKSLNEALDAMKRRIPSETINNIILNISQTNMFGNSILDTMENQIEFLSEKQILEIKGQINKIPNKISIISVIFIIPLILTLILGPFLINWLG
ncbi:MAG: type II secretion system F family protein [Bacilli bacterium]|nr:type II secretion system F family protein [Bacilli bacterium]MDD4808482.1 type II secretion system F family protein [Bacilli bacterium]